MKKTVFILMGVLMAMTIQAQDIVSNFQKKFEKDAEFSIVNISPKMFELVSVVADGEDQGILKKLTGLKMITSTKMTDKLYKEASKLLGSSDHEELMSVVDKEDNIQMFTREIKKGVIGSLIITIQEPQEFTMIGITGDIDLKELSTISKTFNINKMNKIEEATNTNNKND